MLVTPSKFCVWCSAFGGYIAGLGTTIAVMNIFETAQPALLYIVPAVLGAVGLHAWANKEFKQVLYQACTSSSVLNTPCRRSRHLAHASRVKWLWKLQDQGRHCNPCSHIVPQDALPVQCAQRVSCMRRSLTTVRKAKSSWKRQPQETEGSYNPYWNFWGFQRVQRSPRCSEIP